MADPPDPPLFPGMDAVGRGIYLRPYQSYKLTQVLFKREDPRSVNLLSTGKDYSIPSGYAIDDSPQLPSNQALNQVIIEESYDRLEKILSVDSNVLASGASFSINASGSQNSHLRSEQDAYYAIRVSFVPLWSAYVSDTGTFAKDLEDPSGIPEKFDAKDRAIYEEFFNRVGSHVVLRAWVGGRATLVVTVLKSTSLSQEDIKAGIKASFSPLGSADSNSQLQRSRDQLRQSSQTTTFGQGGDKVKLASMSSLDEAKYNDWLGTIKDKPETIDMEVAGIWTLVKNPKKARALQDAYKAEVTFTTLAAVFEIGPNLWFVRGNSYFEYVRSDGSIGTQGLLVKALPELSDRGFERIDSALSGKGLVSRTKEGLDHKIWFFRQNLCLRIDITFIDEGNPTVDKGYPKLISEEWPGIPFERIDAALSTGSDTIYFFSGNRYVRFDWAKGRVAEGYPEMVSKRWVGVTFDRINAAVYWGGGKVYFFKEDQHIRYDITNYRADAGYPKYIVGNYVEDWKFIE